LGATAPADSASAALLSFGVVRRTEEVDHDHRVVADDDGVVA
jgi:hypothetical protein